MSFSNINGYILAIVAVFCYGLLAPLYKKFGIELSPFALMITNSIAITIASIAALFVAGKINELSTVSINSWVILLLIGFINFFSFYLFLMAISKINVIHYDMIALLGPIIGGTLAFFILREPITVYNLVGLAIMGIGLYIGLFYGKAPA